MDSPQRIVTLMQPRTVVCGAQASQRCVTDLLERGMQRILFITGRYTARYAQEMAERLREHGSECQVDSGISHEPTIADFEASLRAARAFAPHTVVGLGGGSPLDVAKLVAALLPEKRDVRDFFGTGLLAPRRTHLVCLPSTSGTGSEVSPNSILLDEAQAQKKAVISPWLVPDATYIDPSLMTSMPALVTAGTAMDALTHCIEAYANKFAHPAVDAYALSGIRLIADHLLTALNAPADLRAREHLAIASCFGGFCLGPVNTAAVHALSYPLGGRFHVPHGIANALLLPHVLRFNLPAAPARYAAIAQALGCPPQGSAEEQASQGIARIEELAREAAIPMRLGDWGVPREAIGEMAFAAMEVTRLLGNNPRIVTHADAEAIYLAAY
jgi:alcohol dehydrogenase class IV